ncbi:hypothetical protein FQN54_003051 [Arachnomyces sp. PD_36]|nr:hypothetical protein FQN54_003051 [Arachnomyces sp. PD_36]
MASKSPPPFPSFFGPENTIYRDETGLDPSFEITIDFTKVEFISLLKESEASSIFHVNYHDEPRVIKAFHNNEDPGYAGDGVRDLNRTRCEIRAYCRLKSSKVCDEGFVPEFYGYMSAVDPALWTHLSVFQNDIDHPSVIMIEYLPNPIPMNSVTFSKERFEKVNVGIERINSALVEHNDPYPKNVLIVPGEPERVVWIDFDVAIVYPADESYMGERERGWFKLEAERVKSYGTMLEEDQKNGLPPNTKYY